MTKPLDFNEVEDLIADYRKNGSVALQHAGHERILATVASRSNLLHLIRRIEWHQQRANYEPECAYCSQFQSDGHTASCRVGMALSGQGLE